MFSTRPRTWLQAEVWLSLLGLTARRGSETGPAILGYRLRFTAGNPEVQGRTTVCLRGWELVFI